MKKRLRIYILFIVYNQERRLKEATKIIAMKIIAILSLIQLAYALPTSRNMFTFNVKCSTIQPSLCSNMTQSLQSAGLRISKMLTIKKKIIVSVSIYSFGAGMNYVLGDAAPSSYGQGRTDPSRPFSTYPQALLKQIDPLTNYLGPDIIANFNSDFNFYLSSSRKPIQPGQYDFEYVVCHELTHGLGFINDFSTYFGVAPLTPSFLIPPILVDTKTETEFEGWSLPNTFDTFLYDTNENQSLFSYQSRISNFSSPNTILGTMDSSFENDGDSYTAAISNLNASESGALKFITRKKSLISLYSPGAFATGSSISHLDSNYFGTADFLMIYSISGCKHKVPHIDFKMVE